MGKTLSLRERFYLWEHAGQSGSRFPDKNCNICHQPIINFDDMELDHIRAYSKGGQKLAMVHRTCNRMKSSGSLREIQKRLGIEGSPEDNARKIDLNRLLQPLKIKQLKELCDELGVERPTARDVGTFVAEMEAPSKSAYIKRIIKSNVDIDKIKNCVSKCCVQQFH